MVGKGITFTSGKNTAVTVTTTMRFEGEKCTLSFGLSFDNQRVSLSGTLWPRRPPTRPPRVHPLRLPFSALFTEPELLSLQHWLTADDAPQPLPLPGSIRHIMRATGPDPELVYLDLEFVFDQVPPWWDWPISFPLRARLEIRPNELAFLTKSLGREQWSANLTW